MEQLYELLASITRALNRAISRLQKDLQVIAHRAPLQYPELYNDLQSKTKVLEQLVLNG